MVDPVKEPHPHDVLSGRGNFVNYHDGNEYFRKLVRKHKLEYVNCPKQQKGKFSKLIVDEIRARNPPGRFLKQDKDSKLWYDIGEKKSLDKTRQALREGAPELMNNGKPNKESELAYNKPVLNHQLNSSEYDMLQQSIMSLGNDSNMTQNFSPGGLMSRTTFNNNNMSGMGLSPEILASPIYQSPGMMAGSASNSSGAHNNDHSVGNRTGGMALTQMIPPPQVHQPDQSLQEQQLQQLRLLQQQRQQQQNQQRQSQQQNQHQFTPQREQEIIRNATAVMGNDFVQQPNNNQQQQLQPAKIHMDQLRINRLKEKRKLLEQQIMHQRQLELLELKKLQNQQKMNDFQQQQQQQQTSSEMRGALQSRLGAVYAGTDALLEPTPMAVHTQPLNDAPSSSRGVPSEIRDGGSNGDDGDYPKRRGIQRENSLKMESIFEDGTNTSSSGSVLTVKNKKHDASMSGMSMSATSLSLGFEEESELSAMFDTSMKFEQGGGNYTTGLNDRRKERKIKADLLGMSLATITAEKSNSSMSCDSSLSRLFDDSGTPGK